jgi:RNA polymerase sigma factor (sigma-70 family)
VTPSDTALIEACRQGDEDAWRTLIQRYQRLLYAIPRRAGLSEELSADVFQNVLEKLVEKLDDIEQSERIRAWLVTTARRETWRIGQRVSAGPHSLDSQETSFDVPDTTMQPEQQLLDLEEQHRVRTAVEQLESRCRELLTMLYYQDEPLPYTEIAEKLQVSIGSIGPTRARCLQKVLKLLEEANETF